MKDQPLVMSQTLVTCEGNAAAHHAWLRSSSPFRLPIELFKEASGFAIVQIAKRLQSAASPCEFDRSSLLVEKSEAPSAISNSKSSCARSCLSGQDHVALYKSQRFCFLIVTP